MTATNPLTFDFSNPDLYNSTYIPLFENKARFLHLYGSAGSGKSAFGFQKEIIKSFEWYRRKRKTLVVRQTATTLKDSCYEDLKHIIYEWGLDDCFTILKNPMLIKNKLTEVEFIFRGLDDVEKIKSVKNVDRIIIEEATELSSMKPLRQLSLRLRGLSNPQITLMYNPVDENHWLNTEVHQGNLPNHFIKKTTYKDNRFLDDEYIEELEGLASQDSNYYNVYVLGNWGTVVEGLIYSKYEIENEFPQIGDEDDIDYYGLDFGFSDPHALVALKVQDALPKKKLIVKEVLYKSSLDATGLIAEFDALGVKKNIKMIADSARPEMIQALKNAGYNCVGCEKFAGSVLSGINRVRNYRICIVAGSKNVFKEIRNYQKKEIYGVWLEDPAPNQVDHLMDAIRYGEQGATIIELKPKKSTSKQNYW
ncbi:MAG TPA: PBSX family phage terminase large subunit [Pyrinomonadaceae bacterium]|nr:PBSX family phage terminase large subunit [Pyrinomonadaceae bacterium]